MQPVLFQRTIHHPNCPLVRPRPNLPAAVAVRAGADASSVFVSADSTMTAAKAVDSDMRAFAQDMNTNPVFGAIRRLHIAQKGDDYAGPSALKKVVKPKSAAELAAEKAADDIVAKMSPDQVAAHDVFLSAQNALEYDWWGESMGDETWWSGVVANGRKAAGPFWKGSDNDVLEAVYKDNPTGLGTYKALQIKRDKLLSSIGQAELDQVNHFRSRLGQQIEQYEKLGYKAHLKLSDKFNASPSFWDHALTALKWTAGATIVGGAAYMVWRLIPKSPAHADTMPAPAPAPNGV